MRERERIEDQLLRGLEGGAWHGPALLELLHGVTAEQAAAHPVPGAHSIWELVLHLESTYSLVLRRLHGESPTLTKTEDWPPVPEPTEENWRASMAALRSLNQLARHAVQQLPDDRLDQPVVPHPPYTAWIQFTGLTQHDLYHAGQVALLKRAMGI
jgi:uncharacterized damage-inducible protein DinB